MGCRLVQAATLAAFIHIVFTSEVIAQDPTDLDKDDVPGRMLTHLRKNYSGQKRFAPQVQVGPYLPFHGCWRDEYFQIMNFCGPCPVLFIISAIFRIFTAYYGLWALP